MSSKLPKMNRENVNGKLKSNKKFTKEKANQDVLPHL